MLRGVLAILSLSMMPLLATAADDAKGAVAPPTPTGSSARSAEATSLDADAMEAQALDETVELLDELDRIQTELEDTRRAAADARRRATEAQAELERLEAEVAAADAAADAEARGETRVSRIVGRPEAGEGAAAPLSAQRMTLNRRSNLRVGPGTQQAIVATLDAGTVVTGFAAVGGWVRVSLDDGRRGWIFGDLLDAADGSSPDRHNDG